MFRLDLTLVLMSLVFIGCNRNSAIVQYEVDRESDKVLTSDVLQDQFDPIPFRWKVPAEWTEAENDQVSAVAWTVGSKKDAPRITVSVLSKGSGVESQFVRWRGQLKLAELSVPEVMKLVEEVALKGATGKWCEFRNDTESIFGLIVAHKDKLWIFKYRGANAAAAIERDRFRSFCESLQIESAE